MTQPLREHGNGWVCVCVWRRRPSGPNQRTKSNARVCLYRRVVPFSAALMNTWCCRRDVYGAPRRLRPSQQRRRYISRVSFRVVEADMPGI